jgi:hypothetical protein
LTPAAANKLGVDRSAAGAVNAVAFTTQPKVSVLDIDGNVVTTSTASIGAAVVEAGATLAGTTPVAAVAGINTFAGLKLTGTVGTYTLRYTSTGLTSVDDSITLTYGAADHLAISTGATGIVNRVAFTGQPTVLVQDVSNNTVFNSTASIVASASTGNGYRLAADVR